MYFSVVSFPWIVTTLRACVPVPLTPKLKKEEHPVVLEIPN